MGDLLAEALSTAPPSNPAALQRQEDPRLKRSRIRGDRKKLLRALVALLEHAFQTAGDTPVRLELETAPGDRLRLAVVCPSVSLPGPEERERMFEGFRCVDGMESPARGVGLGLPLARMIAEAHQGEVGFGDEPEVCSLWMSLPVARAVEEKSDDPV